MKRTGKGGISMAYTSILGGYEIVPCETCHIDSCIAMALENRENQQAYNRKVLGEALWESAFGGWRESLESAVREQQAGETAYLLLENGLFAGLGAFRCAG